MHNRDLVAKYKSVCLEGVTYTCITLKAEDQESNDLKIDQKEAECDASHLKCVFKTFQ